jgi:hypothetical protein
VSFFADFSRKLLFPPPILKSNLANFKLE